MKTTKKCPKCENKMLLLADSFVRLCREPVFLFSKEMRPNIFVCKKCHFMEFYIKDEDFEELV